MKKIALISPPAAGKGTQAALISKHYQIPNISTGQLLRNEVNKKSEIGLMIEEKMNSGRLIDGNIVINLLKKRIKEADCQNGFILDGYPRNIEQAILLEQFEKLDYLFLIEIDQETAKKRILGRLVCENCKANFNQFYQKPKKDNVCDICGGDLIRRNDDTEEVLNERFKVYQIETAPLLDYYKKILFKVDGTLSIDMIFSEIRKMIDEN